MKKILKYLLVPILLIAGLVYFGNDIIIAFESDSPSKSTGTPKKGTLINGKRLPSAGENFVTYSRIGSLLGRNSVHEKVREAVLDSYEEIHRNYPGIDYMIGETSWPGGGNFWPHKTHQNGLSVDFMVPVKDTVGNPVLLPSSIFNKFGYGIEFDTEGNYKNLKIDFEAIGIHLLQLNKSAEESGLKIEVVIFDNDFQDILFKTKYGNTIKKNIRFSKLKPWIRHDEHYHITFKLIPGS